jgi:quercetin dioxygenase-like cupin family protein
MAKTKKSPKRAKARSKPPSRSKSRSAKRPRTAPVKAALQYTPWSSVPLEELNPLFQRHFVVGQEIMLARVLMKKGCIVPEHSHHNEQLTYILEGALKFWIEGRDMVVNAGETLCIPSNMPHKAEALEDTVDLDVFSPPREDWINKSDEYLRRTK